MVSFLFVNRQWSVVLTMTSVLCLFPGTHGADVVYTLDEQQPANTVVGNVKNDYDLRSTMTAEEYAHLQYQILASGNEFAHMFGIVNNTGELYTTQPIDRDDISQCARSPTCLISLGLGVATIGSFFRRLDVDVNVIDINDNRPAFPSSVVTVQFYENSAEGESASIAGAQDRDSGNFSVVGYYVDTQNVPFSVEMEKFVDGSSIVKIIVTGKLDREKEDYYGIRVVAEDGGTPAKTGTVDVNIHILDVNDNAPTFVKKLYNVTLNEDTPLNTVFETVSAADPDLGESGEVQYKLSPFNSETVKNLFAINSSTGELSVIGQLVYIPNEQTVIYVDAFDKGDQPRSSRGVVYVNIKDSSNNPPSINVNILLGENGMARISEYANVGTPVAHIQVTDDDTDRNGKVECIAISDNFGLERYEKKEYKAVVTKSLNREMAASHEVQIVCQDNGSPPLNTSASFTVIVLDENNNKPTFTQNVYYPKIEENNKVGAVVAKVTATDIDIGKNSQVVYSLKESSGLPFWIDKDNGDIRANFVLDRENLTYVSLIVQADDQGQPRLSSSSTVILSILDQNDNRPNFTQPNYEFFVYENLPYNTSVDQLTATDPDNGENKTIVFAFGEPVPSSFPFTLYSDGNIKVIRSLDRELQSVYRFTVVAADQGSPPLSSSVTVTVSVLDQNDNSPIFLFPTEGNDTAEIPLSSSSESVRINITATDKDAGVNGFVSYSIVDKNVTQLFYLENTAGVGVIRLIRLPDGSEPSKYSFRVKAEDGGSPARSVVKSLTVSFTTAVPSEEISQNFLIAITMGCVTVILSIAIVLTIYLIRRNDLRRRKAEEATAFGDKVDYQITPSDIKHVGELTSSSSGSKDSLKKVSFSTEHNCSLVSDVHRMSPPPPLINLDNIKMIDTNGETGNMPNATSSPRSYPSSQHDDKTQRLDPASVLQIHRSLLQSHDQLWANHRDGHTPSLTTDILAQHEDNGSESSGETATYDSGRGGSESDIQTSMSQSHDNDHIKTVTFANKPKLHHLPKDNPWPESREYSSNIQNAYTTPNNGSQPYMKPILPTRDYGVNPKSHTSHTHSQSTCYPNSKFGNKLSQINDSVSQMTSYDDDDDTTTSGSYTIDNDHDWMNESQPRPVFLSHNEAYC